MTHKFLQLLTLRANLSSLSDEKLLEWLKYFLSEQTGKSTIISGLFRELYNQGENNDNLFWNRLVVKSNELIDNKTSNNNENNNELLYDDNDNNIDYISNIPDSLLSNIGLYLNTQELFTKFNHISHKFIQIGLKSDTIKHFDTKNMDEDNIIDNPPKFKIDSILKNLKSIKIDDYMDVSSIIDISNLKWPQTIEIGMYLFIYMIYVIQAVMHCVCMIIH